MILSACVFLAGAAAAFGRPDVFDQRQSGKTNVRVEVKDAVIIAIGDGEFGGDYDYSYDYADLTVKPEKPVLSTADPSTITTKKPTSLQPSSTTNHNSSQNAAVVLEAENSSLIFPGNKPSNSSSEAVKIPPHSFEPDQIPVVILHETHGNRPNKFLPVKTVEKHYVSSSRLRGKAQEGTETEPSLSQCSRGFYLDSRNRCRRIRGPARERPRLPMGGLVSRKIQGES